jgi:hypothetical protein
MTGPPLVRGTLRSRDLLNPRSGREACRVEPSRCVALELLARVPRPGDAQHELREAFGKEGSLLDAPADLRGGDLRAVLGVQSRVSLADQVGPKKAATVSARTSATAAICRGLMLDPRSGTRPVEHGDHSPPPPSSGEDPSWHVGACVGLMAGSMGRHHAVRVISGTVRGIPVSR